MTCWPIDVWARMGGLYDALALRGTAAFVVLFATIVAGLLFLVWVRRAIRRYVEADKPPSRPSVPATDDWARRPLHRAPPTDRDETGDERE